MMSLSLHFLTVCQRHNKTEGNNSAMCSFSFHFGEMSEPNTKLDNTRQ